MLQSGLHGGVWCMLCLQPLGASRIKPSLSLARMQCPGSSTGCFLSFILPCLPAEPLERVPRVQVIVLKAKGQSLALPFPDFLGSWKSLGHPGMMGVYKSAGCV